MSRADSTHALSNSSRPLPASSRVVASWGVVLLIGLSVATADIRAEAASDRPVAVDHSTQIHFPPIGQQMWGDCTCFSSCYYYNTYTQARDEGLDASTGDPNVVCCPAFLFGLIAQGSWGAECTEHAMARLADVGCATLARHPYPTEPWGGDPTVWPTEAAWVAALNNRLGVFYRIRADDEAGLATIKQHIADGGCAVTRADFLSNYGDYGDSASGPGIDNRVMYRRQGWHYLRHSICICGYDDAGPYVDDRDGQTHYGAFLIVNSEGPDWGWHNSTETGDQGFIWIAYTMFLEGEFGWYDYDLPVSPCFDNAPYPEVYYHDDRPHYRPRLYAAAGIGHEARNLLTFSGGVGPTDAPLFLGPEAIEPTDDGPIPIDPRHRVVVDLTDGISFIPPGVTENVFVLLALDGSASEDAIIANVDFYCDFDGDGVYAIVPGEMSAPVTVTPGTTGYVSASITALIPGDLDGDGDVDLSDLAQLLGNYGMTGGAEYEDGDLDGDGDVDLSDLAALLGNYGLGT